jgi:hypothetical protein
MKENKFYIYSHTDKNGVVRYIGKGYRQYKPFSRAHQFRYRSPEWEEVFSNSNPPKVSIIEYNIGETEVDERENYYINQFGMLKYGGTLVNIRLNLTYIERKEARRLSSKLFYERNRERMRKYFREKARERLKDPENRKKKNERGNTYYQRNKEKTLNHQKEYRNCLGVKEKEKERGRKRRTEKRDEINEYARRYWANNRARLNELHRLNHLKNFEKRRETVNQKRRKNRKLLTREQKDVLNLKQRIYRQRRKDVLNEKTKENMRWYDRKQSTMKRFGQVFCGTNKKKVLENHDFCSKTLG